MAGVMDPKSAIYGFDPSLGKFRLQNSAWASAIALQKELKSIPGLVSDDLKNDQLRQQGLLDDYQKKFGKDADAFREGKVRHGLPLVLGIGAGSKLFLGNLTITQCHKIKS